MQNDSQPKLRVNPDKTLTAPIWRLDYAEPEDSETVGFPRFFPQNQKENGGFCSFLEALCAQYGCILQRTHGFAFYAK